MKKQWFVALLLLLVAAFFVFKFVEEEGKKEENVFKIGAILPLTGNGAAYGENAKNGMMKALAKLNSEQFKGKFQIIFEDSKTDPKEAISAYRRLRAQNINIIISTLSPICLALKPLAINDNVLFFGNASHPSITSPVANNIYRHSSTVSQEVDFLANKIRSVNLGDRKISIVSVNDEYGKTFSSLFAENWQNKSNTPLVLKELYDPKSFDVNTLALKIKDSGSDIVIINSLGSSAGSLVKKIREQLPNSELFASIGFILTGADKIAGESALGLRYVNFNFNADTNIKSSECLEYGTIILIGKLFSESGNDLKEIIKHLESMHQLEINTENMTFLPTNEIVPEIRLDTIK